MTMGPTSVRELPSPRSRSIRLPTPSTSITTPTTSTTIGDGRPPAPPAADHTLGNRIDGTQA
jgi:hypothetical protein